MALLGRSEPTQSSIRGGTARTIARRSGKALLGLVLVLVEVVDAVRLDRPLAR